MNPTTRAAGLARRFNEDEAVWERFLQKRAQRTLRELCGPLTEEELDQRDWREAEAECRATQCHGFAAE